MDTAMTPHAVPGVIENTIDIAASADDVFNYCTDTRRETEWNPKMLEVVKLTDGPLGASTRFRLRLAGVGWMNTEILEFHRPNRWTATGTSRRLDVRFEGEVTQAAHGSRLVVRTVLAPHGPLRLALPMLRTIMRRHWQTNLHTIKARLEDGS